MTSRVVGMAPRLPGPTTSGVARHLKSTVRNATALGGWHRAMRPVDRGVRTRRTFRLFRKVPEYSGSKFWIDRGASRAGAVAHDAVQTGFDVRRRTARGGQIVE